MKEVTFRNFRDVMTQRKRTVDDLVDLFHGKLEENRGFFERVMGVDRRDDYSNVVIPYRSVLEFYFKEAAYLKDTEQEQARLAEMRRPKKPMSEERRQALIAQAAQMRARRSEKIKKD